MSRIQSRVHLGPLTTTFIPPPDCFAYGAADNNASSNVFYAAQTCDNGLPKDASTCWPPATIVTNNWPLGGFGYYSPGLVCPFGYTSACAQTVPAIGNSSTFSNTYTFQFPLNPGETGIGCCPTGGLTCAGASYGWQTCNTVVTTGFINVGTCSGSLPMYNAVTTVNIGPSPTALSGPLIQLVFQSTDIPSESTLFTIPNSMTSTQLGSSNSPTSAGSNASTSSSDNTSIGTAETSGLSSGAKIGVGVGVPLAIILLVALGTFLFLRRRGASQRGLVSPRYEMGYEHKNRPELENGKPVFHPHEIAGHSRPHELSGIRSPIAMHELPSGYSSR